MTRATKISNVNDVRVIEGNGPWDTKSGGKLNVLFELPYEVIAKYLTYDQNELDVLPVDIRGLRAYSVHDTPKGKIGANEWHKIRNELIFTTKGAIQWTCEDTQGNKKTFILDGHNGIWVPPFTLHTYEALEPESSLLVVANTLFNPEDASTQDTFSIETFRELQLRHASH